MANMNQEPQNAEFRLNHGDMFNAPTKVGSQIVRRSLRVFKGVYDFNVGGGATGTTGIPLYDPVFGKQIGLVLPASFIISKVLIDVITSPTSLGSATIALNSGQTAGDLLAATAYTSLTAGLYDGIPTTAAASNIKIPSTQAAPGSSVVLVVATAALTAGLINVHIMGFLSD